VPITVTIDTGAPIRIGKRQFSTGSIAMDNSYPTGGEAITPANLGFWTTIEGLEFIGGRRGYAWEYDKSAGKIIARAAAFSHECLNPLQAVLSLIGAAADVTTFQFGTDMYVVGLDSVVTTALHTATILPVVSIEKRDADGTSNAVELATITYADHDAVGAVDAVFVGSADVGGGVDVASALASPYKVPAGYTLVFKHKTQGTNGGGDAGEAKCHLWVAKDIPNVELPSTFDLSGVTALRFVAWGW